MSSLERFNRARAIATSARSIFVPSCRDDHSSPLEAVEVPDRPSGVVGLLELGNGGALNFVWRDSIQWDVATFDSAKRLKEASYSMPDGIVG